MTETIVHLISQSELVLKTKNKKNLREHSRKLQTFFFSLCLLTSGWFLEIKTAHALSSGDVVIIGLHNDGADEFSWAPLVDLVAGEVIYFSDAGYNAVTNSFLGSGRSEEWLLRYTTPAGGLAAGTVQTVIDGASPANYDGPGTATQFGGLNAGGNPVDLSLVGLGDELIAFQSTDNPAFATFGQSNFTPLFQVDTGSNTRGLFQFDPIAPTHTTDLHSGLTLGVNAAGLRDTANNDEFDNIRYAGATTAGDRATLLAAIANSANWIGTNTAQSSNWTNVLGAGSNFIVTASNVGPTITSNSLANVVENQVGAIDVQSSDDSDSEGAGLTYAKTGGADQALFNVVSGSGVVTFVSAPNFEASTDAGADNNYNIQITVTDSGGLTDVQDIVIAVSNVTEGPIEKNDFNADGKSDLLWRDSVTGKNRLWFLDGNTSTPQGLSVMDGTVWQAVAAGDSNGDGFADLIWRNTTDGRNVLWQMQNNTVLRIVGLPTVSDQNWQVQGMGDTNADDQDDILWRHQTNGRNALWQFQNTAIVTSNLATVSDTNWTVGGMGDGDGDGKADIFWRNQANGKTALWIMDGVNHTPCSLFTLGDMNWQPQGMGDTNDDGRDDVIWRHQVDGRNVIWQLDGHTMPPNDFTTQLANLSWTMQQIGDTDGDGRADIVWRNSTDGRNIVWKMDGYTAAQSGLQSVGNLSWDIEPD